MSYSTKTYLTTKKFFQNYHNVFLPPSVRPLVTKQNHCAQYVNGEAH